MAHGHHIHIEPEKLNQRFELDSGTRKLVFGLLGVGIVLMIIGIILVAGAKKPAASGHDGHHGNKPHSSLLMQSTPFKLVAHQQDQKSEASENTKPADSTKADSMAVQPNLQNASSSAGASDTRVVSKPFPAGKPDHKHDIPGFPVHEPLWLTRLLSNLLLNSFFFTGIAALAIFFIALKYATNAGWHVQFLRIAEAMGPFLIIGAILLLIIFFAGKSSLYHWADSNLVASDELLQKKKGYLNMPFFLVRSLIYFSLWIGFFLVLRKSSLLEDEIGGIKEFNKRTVLSAVFLVVFGLTFSLAAWDWMMSIEAHWFSTMFSVRCFSTCFVSFWALLLLVSFYLKSKGYLPYVNESHFHDLGKFVFAFSVFWTYIWFSEFMLIWYANIPEEGLYFFKRLQEYPIVFFTMFVLNFVVPFLTLLSKSNMRHVPTMVVICVLVLIGHWLDVYLMVIPGTMQTLGSFGLLEIGTFITFLGAFLAFLAVNLPKAPLVPKNHPYLKESLYHQYH